MHKMEYKLKFILDSQTLKILDIEDKTDTKRLMEFNNSYCDCKKIQGFCSKIENVTKFPLFNVPLSQGTTHKVLFCEVAVGNSLFVSSSYADNLDVPSGYDSLMFSSNPTSDYLTDENFAIKDFSYAVKDSKRILPLYEVTFEYNEEFERKNKGKNICHRCEAKDAIMFCPAERASFCDTCDKEVHNDSFLKRHERKYFAELGQSRFICCSYHPSKTVEYFCEECMECICTECKITGNHSKISNHEIKPFLEVCKEIKKKIEVGEPPLLMNYEHIQNDLKGIKDRVSSFRMNMVSVRKQVEREIKNLLLQSESIESENRQVLNAKFLERACKGIVFEQMAYYPRQLDPADLLSGYRNISEQRKSEKLGSLEKIETEQVEVSGKITLRTPVKAQHFSSNVSDTAVSWRVETMHIDGKGSVSN